MMPTPGISAPATLEGKMPLERDCYRNRLAESGQHRITIQIGRAVVTVFRLACDCQRAAIYKQAEKVDSQIRPCTAVRPLCTFTPVQPFLAQPSVTDPAIALVRFKTGTSGCE